MERQDAKVCDGVHTAHRFDIFVVVRLAVQCAWCFVFNFVFVVATEEYACTLTCMCRRERVPEE